ncbi:MAG: DUF2786 domain-containing protein [Desulfosarcinaceae bacterium]|nr:DUF2786 domain-containing protein [Desulfosarcinaceae bacterium]
MKPSDKLAVELERRILHGLCMEWVQIRDQLSDEMAAKMHPPLFSLSNADGRLGSWHPDRKEIRISRRLVLNHPWDAVCDVLRHEMAHQLVSVFWPNLEEAPHGDAFHRACHHLNADPTASGTYPTLDQRIFGKAVSEEDRILMRVQKLMALSDSPNVHEAEAAMVKAYALIAKYNLKLLRREHAAAYVSVYLGQPALRHFREAYALGGLLQQHYFVSGVWVPAYVLAKGKMGRVLEISGTRANIQIAAYVYDFVSAYIETAWERFRSGRKLSRYRRTDFATGLIEGFSHKLDSAADAGNMAVAEVRALVRREEVGLQQYVARRYPRLSNVRRDGQVDPEIHAAGAAEGRKMVISKGICESGELGSPGLLTADSGS